MTDIVIRPLQTLDEMRAAVDLQRQYWGEDVESLVPAHMLFTIAQYGGHVLAAFDGARMIGVVIGLLGSNIREVERPAMANLIIASKRMVVLPAYRSHGIGYKLKLAQRDAATKQGVRLVTWTFDPLRAPNAHLNLRKLGGVCEKYLVNLYGENDLGGLAQFGWSDRLQVDWWVTNRRVEERLNGTRPNLTLEQYLGGNAQIINPAAVGNVFIQPGAISEISTSFGLVEIPLNYADMTREDEALAQRWQAHIRRVFTLLMASGFTVTDFVRTSHEGRDRAFYLCSFNMSFDASLN